MGDCSNSNPVLNNVTALRGAKFIHRIKISVLWFGENILEGHEKQLAVPAKEVREISLPALSGSYNLSALILGSFGALVFWSFTLWLLWVWGGLLKQGWKRAHSEAEPGSDPALCPQNASKAGVAPPERGCWACTAPRQHAAPPALLNLTAEAVRGCCFYSGEGQLCSISLYSCI